MTPLAFEMLIGSLMAMNSGNSFVPSDANKAAWEEAIDYAVAEGLVESRSAPISARGRAWLEMIHATPLPVQVWVDPRNGLGEFRGHSVDASDDGLTPRQRAQRDRRAREAGKPPYSPPPPLSVAEGSVKEAGTMPTIPPGFTAWDGSAAAPPGMRSDQPVEVMRRNGKIVSKVGGDQLYAISVNWRNNNKPDDTIAYRLTTDPLDMEE